MQEGLANNLITLTLALPARLLSFYLSDFPSPPFCHVRSRYLYLDQQKRSTHLYSTPRGDLSSVLIFIAHYTKPQPAVPERTSNILSGLDSTPRAPNNASHRCLPLLHHLHPSLHKRCQPQERKRPPSVKRPLSASKRISPTSPAKNRIKITSQSRPFPQTP